MAKEEVSTSWLSILVFLGLPAVQKQPAIEDLTRRGERLWAHTTKAVGLADCNLCTKGSFAWCRAF